MKAQTCPFCGHHFYFIAGTPCLCPDCRREALAAPGPASAIVGAVESHNVELRHEVDLLRTLLRSAKAELASAKAALTVPEGALVVRRDLDDILDRRFEVWFEATTGKFMFEADGSWGEVSRQDEELSVQLFRVWRRAAIRYQARRDGKASIYDAPATASWH